MKNIKAIGYEDQVIKRYDPEWADMSNPHGAVWGSAWVIEAATPEGDRFFLVNVPQDQDACYALVDRINAKGEINLKHWGRGEPVYGSKRFEEEQDEYARREMEDAINN